MLVVGAESDRRASTAALKQVVGDLSSRRGVVVHCWFLRDGDVSVDGWPNPRVIDRLRTWEPVGRLERLGLRRLADLVRGARLRWWLVKMRPGVVVLDDGVGSRVLRLVPGRPIVVVRHNPGVPAGARFEPTFDGAPDLTLVADASESTAGVRDGGRLMRMPMLVEGLVGDTRAWDAGRGGAASVLRRQVGVCR